LNGNLIFKWLKNPRFAPTQSATSVDQSVAFEGVFLPVEIEPSAMESPSAIAHMNDMAADPNSSVLAQRVDIALSDGRRILVEGPTSLASVVRLVQGLTA
jgi:transposase